jgi:hypothetical protein
VFSRALECVSERLCGYGEFSQGCGHVVGVRVSSPSQDLGQGANELIVCKRLDATIRRCIAFIGIGIARRTSREERVEIGSPDSNAPRSDPHSRKLAPIDP